MKKMIAGVIAALVLLGCADGGSTQNAGSHYNYTFAVDAEGWTGGFADYDKYREARYGLSFSHSRLPSPLNENDGAIRISGNNRSDELFMFIKTRIGALDINTTYEVVFTVEFASNAADESGDHDGSAGEDVTLKVGAMTMEPLAVEDASGYYRMNIDKGIQASSGSNMVAIGDFSNDSGSDAYRLKTVRNTTPLYVTADENGSAWMIVGTDSGFRGRTTIYYNQVSIDLRKITSD